MPRRPRNPKEARAFVDSVMAPWRADLVYGKHGPKPTLANAITALRQAPEWQYVLAFDAFQQTAICQCPAPWQKPEHKPDNSTENWTDIYDVYACEWLQHAGIEVNVYTTGRAADMVARENPFHPVLDYLASCAWDCQPRLDRWAIDYLGAEDTPYVRAVSAKWMIGAVARVHQPGCKLDTALICEGKQGLGKSKVIRILGSPWVSDELAEFGSKDAAIQLAGVWIVELAELDSIGRSEVSRIKAFMSRSKDRFRPPYATKVIDQPRQCAFVGTVNGNEYLRDETGGRRFWPIECSKADPDGIGRVRDQLWAEASSRYQAGEKWWLDEQESPQLAEDATQAQAARYQQDPWQSEIGMCLPGRDFVTVEAILKDVIGFNELSKQTQADMNRVARCLRALGWVRKQVRLKESGKAIWRYVPANPS